MVGFRDSNSGLYKQLKLKNLPLKLDRLIKMYNFTNSQL